MIAMSISRTTRRLVYAMLGFTSALAVFAGDGRPVIGVAEIPAPEGAPAAALAITGGPGGNLWVSWVTIGSAGSAVVPAPPGPPPSGTLRFAAFDGATQAWTFVRTIASRNPVVANPADCPQVASDGARGAFAVWTDGRGGASCAQSRDGGLTWSEPAPWTTRSPDVEKFSLARLSDGRILAAWLDGRGRDGGAGRQKLYARIVGQPESQEWLVDPEVCDCCQTSIVPFLDGGAVLAYRGRTHDEVRDIRAARFEGGHWDQPYRLHRDNWQLTACPVNGPRLAGDGSRVGAVWFTGADGTPRVLASFSPDAGERWLEPLRVDRGRPTGHPDVVLLRDGALLVAWGEADGSLWLRRISPDYTADEPVALCPPGAASARGFPRLGLVADYAGDRSVARLLVAYAAADGRMQTRVATVPEGELLTAERHCDCAPTPGELAGFALRGVIVATDPSVREVLVRHAAVPGVFPSGDHRFAVFPDDMPSMQTGRPFLGRITRRAAGWALEDIRYLGDPVPAKAVR
jgi:hypothetical protein